MSNVVRQRAHPEHELVVPELTNLFDGDDDDRASEFSGTAYYCL